MGKTVDRTSRAVQQNGLSSEYFSQCVLEYLIASKGYRQRALSKALEIDESFLSRVRHRKETFSLSRLLQIADAVDIPLPNLIACAVEYASPEAWEQFGATSEGAATKRILAQRAKLHGMHKRLYEAIALLSKRLESYCERVPHRNREYSERLRRILRLCDEACSSGESRLELLAELCKDLSERLARRRKHPEHLCAPEAFTAREVLDDP